MIHVAHVREPDSFDEKVRKPGQRLLKELRGDATAPKRRGPKRKPVPQIKPGMLKEFWTECLDELAEAFHHACAYCCIRVDPVTGARTVDHFIPKKDDPDNTYEWKNLRFSCLVMNKRKDVLMDKNKDARLVCDAFTLEDGWYQLNLLTFGLKPKEDLPDEKRALVQLVIDELGLDKGEMRKRREAAWELFAGERSAAGWKKMEDDCPLVAREYIRQRGKPVFDPSTPKNG